MTRIPPLNTQPTKSAKEYRKTRQMRGTCMAVRGCTMQHLHSGPHRIAVSTASIERAKARGVVLRICLRCGFYGSGAHTIAPLNEVRCVPRRGARWQER